MRPNARIVFLTLILLVPSPLAAQYWSERAMEKGFEQVDFFFKPSFLNPYSIGNFKSATPGLLQDPLLNVMLTPARLGRDSLHEQYFYADFRTARDLSDQDRISVIPATHLDAGTLSDLGYYPRSYLGTHRELEPLFSGAYLGRPLPSTLRNFAVGLTYQLMLQDDKYYSVPQDIYRSVPGYDYGGVQTASTSVPIIDRTRGEDNIHHTGHFINAFASYILPFGLDVGLKVGRVTFTRKGVYGYSNSWQSPTYATGNSVYDNMERRDQRYAHWDLSGGAEYHLTEWSTVGAMAGYLWGDATQSLTDNDYSHSSSSNPPSSSLYYRELSSSRDWRHHGKTFYASTIFTSQIVPNITMTLLYRYQHQRTNLQSGAAISDTSRGASTLPDGNGEVRNQSSQSFLSDMREGGGRWKTTDNHLQASFLWKVDEKVTLATGLQLDWQRAEAHTQEGVDLASRSAYSYSGTIPGRRDWDYELKDLFWDFAAEQMTFQVPVFLTIKTSGIAEWTFGLNRTMTRWTINDVTLALFKYRSLLHDGTVNEQQNFGERYTSPEEQVTDVRTSFLAGVTLSPSQKVQIRLLLVPNISDTHYGPELEQLQWWIGLALIP